MTAQDRSFLAFIQQQRDEFVNEYWQHHTSARQRVIAENLLIAYDQMHEIIKGEKKEKLSKAEITYNEIYEALEPRLNQLGQIRTDDAWMLLRGRFSYNRITVAFRQIMLTMVEQGKAKKVLNGKYEIIAANIKQLY